MAGRLNAIDLESDLYFIILSMTEESLYRGDLKEILTQVDMEAFSFGLGTDDYSAFMDNLRMLKELGAINRLRQRHRIELTEKGHTITSDLIDVLDEDQRNVLVAAIEDAGFTAGGCK